MPMEIMLIVLANIYGTLVMNVIFRTDYYFIELSQQPGRQAVLAVPAIYQLTQGLCTDS